MTKERVGPGTQMGSIAHRSCEKFWGDYRIHQHQIALQTAELHKQLELRKEDQKLIANLEEWFAHLRMCEEERNLQRSTFFAHLPCVNPMQMPDSAPAPPSERTSPSSWDFLQTPRREDR